MESHENYNFHLNFITIDLNVDYMILSYYMNEFILKSKECENRIEKLTMTSNRKRTFSVAYT